MHVHTCMHARIHSTVDVLTCMHERGYTNSYLLTCENTQPHTHTHKYKRARVCAHTHAQIYPCILAIPAMSGNGIAPSLLFGLDRARKWSNPRNRSVPLKEGCAWTDANRVCCWCRVCCRVPVLCRWEQTMQECGATIARWQSQSRRAATGQGRRCGRCLCAKSRMEKWYVDFVRSCAPWLRRCLPCLGM